MVEKLTRMAIVSELVDSKMNNLEQRAQDQWKILEKKVDGKSATRCQSGCDHPRVVQKMPMKGGRTASNEDNITTNTIEVLRSGLSEFSAKKMAEEVVCMK